MKKMINILLALLLVFSFSALAQQRNVQAVNGWELTGINSSSPDLNRTKSFVDSEGQVFASYGATRPIGKSWTIQMTWSKVFVPNLLLPDSVSLNSQFITGVGDIFAVCIYINIEDSSGSWYFLGNDRRVPLDSTIGKILLWDLKKVRNFGINSIKRFSISFQVTTKDSSLSYTGADVKLRSLSFFYGADARIVDFGFVTGIEPVQIVQDFVLEQNYPNPFNPSTTIKFTTPQKEQVSLIVFNSLGQEVRTLVSGERGQGSYEVSFDASNLPSGTYFYRLQAGASVQVKKMLLTK